MNSASVLSSGHCMPGLARSYALAAPNSPVERAIEEARALPFPLPERELREHFEAIATGEALRGEDLALAWACARGMPEALAAFEARHVAGLRAVHARARGEKPPFDELMQIIRAKLFTGERPRIAEYRGKGALESWVRVVGARVLVEAARRTKRTRPLEESGATPIAAPGDDPETAYLKRRYAAEVRDAFEEAARRLDDESRDVLRDHYVDGLGIDAIAARSGVHRATAARRLAGAREAVLRETRQVLMRRLRVSRDELESIVRMVESRMHVTVERVFGR